MWTFVQKESWVHFHCDVVVWICSLESANIEIVVSKSGLTCKLSSAGNIQWPLPKIDQFQLTMYLRESLRMVSGDQDGMVCILGCEGIYRG